MNKKRKIFLIILVIVSSFVITVEVDNYFNGGLSDHSRANTQSTTTLQVAGGAPSPTNLYFIYFMLGVILLIILLAIRVYIIEKREKANR